MREDWKIPVFLAVTLGVLSFFAYRESSLRVGLPRPATQGPAPESAAPAPVAPVPPGNSPAAVSAPDTERDRKIAAAIAKYGERPVAREFIEELKKDPCAAKAVADGKDADLLELLTAARAAGCLDKLRLKYAFRPAFIKLLAEIMSDPEIGPLLKNDRWDR